MANPFDSLNSFADKFGNIVSTARGVAGGGNIIERYPSTVESQEAPFILFTRHKAEYNSSPTSSGIRTNPQGHVSLYMPMGISINDNMVYENAATGLSGAGIDSLINGVNPENFTQNDAIAAVQQFGDEAAMATGGIIGSKLGAAGALLGGAGVGTLAKSAISEAQKRTQISMNPREFMLFKSPGMRNFSLQFRFIPDSIEESQTAERIIKWFREGMYPERAGSISFRFPDAFNIKFSNISGVPKIPEVFLESASVTYNPNSMSYFRIDNRPVEVNLSLEFKELQPITRESIQEGF